MADGRQATRPTPITVRVDAINDHVVVAPLAWQARNDLGQLIVRSYADALTRVIASQGAERLFLDAEMDYKSILAEAGLKAEQTDKLAWSELMEVCHAICDVNGLENNRMMLDPNWIDPRVQKAIEGISDGEKITSSEGSSDSASE